ncbi:MAG: hypothetical protein R3F65_11940 [bacterium]|nr:hypothetical protein [Myxococcales bacterium]
MYLQLDYWITRQRELLEAHDATRWLVTRFVDLRQEMVSLRRDPSYHIAEARAAVAAQDAIHDDDLRAGYYALLALEHRARTPEDKKRFKDARDRIFHGGLAMVNRAYADEASESLLVLSRIDGDVRRLLAANMLGDESLGVLFDRWREEARRLGELDAMRTEIEAQAKLVGGSSYLGLRKAWMELVRAFRSAVALLPAEPRHALSARLDEAEARADARAAARRARGAVAVVDDPEGLLPEDGSAGRGEVDEDLFEDSPAVSPGVTPVEGAPASVG